MLTCVSREPVIDAGRRPVCQERSVHVGGGVGWSSAAAIVLQRALTRELCELDGKELRANAGCAIRPQPIIGEQRRKLAIATRTADCSAGQQLVAALAVEAVVESKRLLDLRHETRGGGGCRPVVILLELVADRVRSERSEQRIAREWTAHAIELAVFRGGRRPHAEHRTVPCDLIEIDRHDQCGCLLYTSDAADERSS